MGYNSVILVCNDHIGSINKDPKSWWKRAWNGLASVSWKKPEYTDGGTQAVWNQHADVVGLIMVGGNHATVLGGTSATGGSHHDEETQDRVLKEILRERGYVVYKKVSKIRT